mgnify:CR=1 FL=1
MNTRSRAMGTTSERAEGEARRPQPTTREPSTTMPAGKRHPSALLLAQHTEKKKKVGASHEFMCECGATLSKGRPPSSRAWTPRLDRSGLVRYTISVRNLEASPRRKWGVGRPWGSRYSGLITEIVVQAVEGKFFFSKQANFKGIQSGCSYRAAQISRPRPLLLCSDLSAAQLLKARN